MRPGRCCHSGTQISLFICFRQQCFPSLTLKPSSPPPGNSSFYPYLKSVPPHTFFNHQSLLLWPWSAASVFPASIFPRPLSPLPPFYFSRTPLFGGIFDMHTVELRGDSYDSFSLCVDGFTGWMVPVMSPSYFKVGACWGDVCRFVGGHSCPHFHPPLLDTPTSPHRHRPGRSAAVSGAVQAATRLPTDLGGVP